MRSSVSRAFAVIAALAAVAATWAPVTAQDDVTITNPQPKCTYPGVTPLVRKIFGSYASVISGTVLEVTSGFGCRFDRVANQSGDAMLVIKALPGAALAAKIFAETLPGGEGSLAYKVVQRGSVRLAERNGDVLAIRGPTLVRVDWFDADGIVTKASGATLEPIALTMICFGKLHC